MKIERLSSLGGLLLAACLLAAGPAAAGTVTAGIDVWNTPNDGNTVVDFTSNPIPAGYFCTGSPAFAQQIALQGSPIVTNPAGALAKTDTVIERLSDAVFDSTLTATTTIQVDALSLVQSSAVTISCTGGNKTFNVTVNRDWNPPSGTQTVGSLTLHESDSTGSGGTFDATVYVPGRVVFTDTATGAKTAPISDLVTLQVSGGAWASSPGTGGVTSGSLQIDSTGGGTANLSVPGTSNFAAGWSRTTNPPSPVPVNHKGPHPTWPLPPPKPCKQTITQAVARLLARHLDAGGAAASGPVEGLPADLKLASIQRYSGGTVVALSHGIEAPSSAHPRGDFTTPIQVCLVNISPSEVVVVGTADGSPVYTPRR